MQILKISFLLLSTFLLIDGTQIEWQTATDHDFGDIRHKQAEQFDFTFKNTGSEAIIIDNVRASCGCTIPDWDPSPILPDSIGIIRVEYDARDLGYFRKMIKVYLSGKRKAEKLYIEGFVGN